MKLRFLFFSFLILASCANPAPVHPTAQAMPIPEAPLATPSPVINVRGCPGYGNSIYYVVDANWNDVVVAALCDIGGTINMSLVDNTLITVELGVKNEQIHWIGAVGKPLGGRAEKYSCSASWTAVVGQILPQEDSISLPAGMERIAMECWSQAGMYRVWAEWSSQPFISPTPNPLFESG